MNSAPAEDEFAVGTVRPAAPGRERSLMGMNAPDFCIPTLLIPAQFYFDVVVTGRWRPNLDNERHRLGINLKPVRRFPQQSLLQRAWNDDDIWDVIRAGRDTQPASAGTDGILFGTNLEYQRSKKHLGRLLVCSGHARSPSQPATDELPLPFRVFDRDPLVRRFADRHDVAPSDCRLHRAVALFELASAAAGAGIVAPYLLHDCDTTGRR
jgi:hypothetical protein